MTQYIIDNIMMIISALLSGGLGLRIYDSFKKKKKRQNAEEFYNDTKEIIDTIDDLTNNPKIDRVLIFRGGNGGSVPKLGKDYFVKAVFESHKIEPPISSLKAFSNVIPDAHYISLLLNLMEDKKEFFFVAQMPDSLLKRIYISEQMTYTQIYLLCQTEEYIFYCSVSTKQNLNFDEDIFTHLQVEASITKLRTLFNKHYNKSFFQFK